MQDTDYDAKAAHDFSLAVTRVFKTHKRPTETLANSLKFITSTFLNDLENWQGEEMARRVSIFLMNDLMKRVEYLSQCGKECQEGKFDTVGNFEGPSARYEDSMPERPAQPAAAARPDTLSVVKRTEPPQSIQIPDAQAA